MFMFIEINGKNFNGKFRLILAAVLYEGPLAVWQDPLALLLCVELPAQLR